MRHDRRACDLSPVESGYLLLELLVVLAILALTLGLAVPNHRPSATSLEPRALATRLASELRLARATAVVRAREVAFEFNAKERWFQVHGAQRIAVPASISVTLTTARDHTQRDTDAHIVFFHDGSSTGGKIALQSGNAIHTVAVDWLTGSVQLEQAPH
jgi:general secretion pathway protein H